DASYNSRLSSMNQERLNTQLDTFNQRLASRFGEERMSTAFRAQSAGLGSTKGLVGVAGLAASVFGLSGDLGDFNRHTTQTALDAGNAAASGSDGIAAAKEVNALRSGATAEDAAAAAGRFATFAKFGGLATGVAGGGFQIVQGIRADDGVQIAQGGVTIA